MQVARTVPGPDRPGMSLVARRESGTPITTDTDLQSLLTDARAEISALRSQRDVSTHSSNVSDSGHNENRFMHWTVFKDGRLIPEFDPSNLTQNIDDWLCRVNECAAVYHWDDTAKIYVALGKYC